MIQSLKQLQGFSIRATDGTIGEVDDAYFDDSEWAVRYLVVKTGSWLRGRRVLLSPLFIAGVAWDAREVVSTLTLDRVKGSPDVDFDKPVSRQQEAKYFDYYGTFGYWAGPFVWGRLPYPRAAAAEAEAALRDDLHARMRRADREAGDSHLRSMEEVTGYHIEALDGGIGHVEDFLFNDQSWLVETLIVDTRNWLPGKHVMVPPDWIQEVDWLTGAARVGVNREDIQERPEYPGVPLVAGHRADARDIGN